VTTVREPNYSLDLPGEWIPAESDDPATTVYRAADGSARASITLLAMRPMFTIADPHGLLEDYLHHRPQFEKGRAPGLEQSEPTSWQEGDVHLGEWQALDTATGARQAHRVILTGVLLADFVYEETGADEPAFAEHAGAVLASANAWA